MNNRYSEFFSKQSSISEYPQLLAKIGLFLIITVITFSGIAASQTNLDDTIRSLQNYLDSNAKASNTDLSDINLLGERGQKKSLRKSFNDRANTEISDLQQNLIGFQFQVDKLLEQSKISSADYQQLVNLYQNIQASYFLTSGYFSAETQRLQNGAVTGQVIPQQLAFVERFETFMNEVGERLDAKFAKAASKMDADGKYDEDYINGIWSKFRLRWSLRAIKKELKKLLVHKKVSILGNSSLPYGRQIINPPGVLNTKSIIPAYHSRDTKQIVPTELDYQGDAETELSTAILKQARLLEYDYVKIFEFVKNNIRLEWYSGSFKGAEQTLLSGSGNDVDQAALLLALYRASGLPARYVHGVVEQSTTELAAILGMSDESQVLRFLSESGIVYTPIARGGRVAAVQREYTWTAVFVPYTNYRGTHVDASGSTWIPLMPAVKLQESNSANLDQSGFNDELVQQLINDYLDATAVPDLRAAFENKVSEILNAQTSGLTYSEYVEPAALISEILELLPNSELLDVINVFREESQLSDDFIPTLQIRSYESELSTSEVIFDIEVPFHEILNKRTSWSYLPAEKEHHELANLYGGLYRAPAYLMRLRSQLKVNGRSVSVGQESLQMGVPHLLELSLKGKFGTVVRNKVVLSGGYHGISVAYADFLNIPEEDIVGDTEGAAGKLLGELARTYTRTVARSEQEAAQVFDVALSRALPSLVFVSNSNDVENLLDQPQTILWNGVEMDALLLPVSPVAKSTDNEAIENSWLDLMALNASAEEHLIFEDVLRVDSISADKGLQIAKETGIAILDISSANAADVNALPFAVEIKESLNYWLQQGYSVKIPADFIQRNAWQGAVWVVSDSITGASGYFIAGNLAGGQTDIAPEDWESDWIRDFLSTPYEGLPNTDPNDAVSMVKLTSSDFQFGKAGEALDQNLTVLVRDALGRPVQGASVSFVVVQGDGNFSGSAESTVFTDFNGVAEAEYTLGESTAINRRYIKIENNDTYSTQIGMSVIEAFSPDGLGLVLQRPFSAFMTPDEATQFKNVRGLTADNQATAFGGQETAVFQTLDQFDNPVANVSVRARLLPTTYGQCTLAANNPVDAEIADTCTDFSSGCGVSNKENETDSFGVTAFQFITGNVLLTNYQFEVTALGQSNTVSRQTGGFSLFVGEECDDTIRSGDNSGIGRYSRTRPAVDPITDKDIYSAEVGERATDPVNASIEYVKYDYEIEDDFLRLYPDISWEPAIGSVSFSGTNGVSVSGSRSVGPGAFEADVTASSSPAAHEIFMNPAGIMGLYPKLSGGNVTLEEFEIPLGFDIKMTDFYSLEAKVSTLKSLGLPAEKNPEFVYINRQNFSVFPIEFEYELLPANYPPLEVGLALYKDDVFQAYYPSTDNATSGAIQLARGNPFDEESQFHAELIVNAGSRYEVRSEDYPINVRSTLLRNYSRSVSVFDEVDLNNQFACSIGGKFEFELSAAANVTLLFSQRGTDPETEPGAIEIFADEEYSKGVHSVSIDKNQLPAKRYDFTIIAERADDPSDKEKGKGIGVSRLVATDQLPIGHTFVKGVDIFDGHLVMSSTDLSIPGQGPQLQFSRTYSSKSSLEIGLMGVGWSSNYNSVVTRNPCGVYTVFGADNSGIKFFDRGGDRLEPGRGYHGTLDVDPAEGFIDYYTTSGVQYHYENRNLVSGPPIWDLAFIKDPNGRNIRMIYDTEDPDEPRLSTVEDSFGRSLEYVYEYKTFAEIGESAEVLTMVTGPLEMSIEFTYDDFGRLITAEREDIRSESYTYTENDPEVSSVLHSKLDSYTNPNGYTTSYTYDENEMPVSITSGDAELTSLKLVTVKTIDEPELGTSTFTYDFDLKTTNVSTNVGNYSYIMNQYGGVESQTEPGGNRTFVWNTDQAKITKETDWAEVATDYTYDSFGNMLSSKKGTFSRKFTYDSQDAPPYIKNLLTSSTDYNENKTTYVNDAKGNLMSSTIGLSTIDYVYSNGNLITLSDANKNITQYRYDSYGYLEETIDPEGGVSGTERDIRGYPTLITDVAQGDFIVETDALGRITQTTNELGGTVITTYDANGNKKSEEDENGNTTTFTYDEADRIVDIQNADLKSKVYKYNAQGFKESETDWKNQATIYTYSPAGFVIGKLYPDGSSVSYGVDALGNRVKFTDENMNVTTYTYDVLSRLTGFTDPAGTVSYTLDGNGNKTKITNRLLRSTDITYTYLNLPHTITDADNGVVTYLYDPVGNEISKNDQENNTSTTEYDKANRVRRKIDPYTEIEEFVYNSRGLLTREIDKRGGTQIHTYDELGRRKTSTDEKQNVYEFEYDPAGNLTDELWPNQNAITHEYNSRNLKKSTKDILGELQTFIYDDNGNVTFLTDPNGNSVTRVYDERDRITEERLPEGRNIVYMYDDVGNLTNIIDPRGGETIITYDSSNREESRIDPAGTTRRTYDAESNIKSVTDRRGKTTTFNYDVLDRLDDSIDPLGQMIDFEYDKNGNRTKETNKKDIVTDYIYDDLNRVTSITKAGIEIASFEYDANGNVILTKDAKKYGVAREYDARNQLERESRLEASVTEYTYTVMGDPKTVKDPEGRITNFDYDKRRRLKTQTLNGNPTNYTYDANGNRKTVKKPKGNTWVYEYDGADRLVDVIDPRGEVTSYTYDFNDNRDSQTDARNGLTRYLYDSANRLRSTTYPDLSVEAYDYDEEGNLETLTDLSNRVISYTYDDLNRPKMRTYPTSGPADSQIQSIVFGFDANNNLTSATENYSGTAGTRITSQEHDDFDRVINITYPGNKKLIYGYDANGNRSSLTDADQKITNYYYDKLNRPTTIVTPEGVTGYTYYRDSKIKSVTYPTLAVSTYTYDDSGRTESITNTQSGAIVSAYTYGYDQNSNPINVTEQQGSGPETITYEFDNLDRLEQAEYIDKRITYSYDANYNRTSEKVTDLIQGSATENQLIVDRVYNHNARNQLQDITDNIDAAQSIAYTYDTNANRATRSQAGVTTEYVYDIRDHMREVKQGGSSIGQFLYDYQGLRVRKSVNGVSQRFIYDDQNVLQETDDAGATIAKYEYGADRLISYNHTTNGQNYYLLDGLNSVTNLLKSDGAIQARYQYDAYGQIRKQSGTSSNRIGFTGQYNDSELGLYYYKARYYDPELGSFLSQDALTGRSITPPSLNRYLYVFSNPTIYTDPTGNIEVLANGANSLSEFDQYLANQAQGYTDAGAGFALRVGAGFAIGVTRFLVKGSEGLTRTVNFSANVLINSVANDESIQAELDGSFAVVQKTLEGVEKIQENPDAAKAALSNAASEFGGKLARGDARAISDLTSVAAELVGGGKALTSTAKGVVKVADAVSDTVSTVKSVSKLDSPGTSNFQRAISKELDVSAASNSSKSPSVKAATANKQAGAAQRTVVSEKASPNTASSSDSVTVYRIQPKTNSGIVTGGAFRRLREAGKNLVTANSKRRNLLNNVNSSDPAVSSKALSNAQANGKNSPFISTTFNKAGAEESFRKLKEQGLDVELVTITGPRKGGVDINKVFERLGGRKKRLKDAELEEFGINDLFIPAKGKSKSGFEIVSRK